MITFCKKIDNIFEPAQNTPIFQKCEHGWSYLGKGLLLLRQALNISIKTCHRYTLLLRQDEKVDRVITRLKLFSIIGVPFSLASVRPTANKIFESMRVNDTKGAVLASLTITIIATDIVDSLITFIDAVLKIINTNYTSPFSSLSMPLAFGLVSGSTVTRAIQLMKTHALYKEVMRDPLHQKERMGQLKRKMATDAVNLTANLLSFIGLSLFFLSHPPALPYFIFASSSFLRIGALSYQDLTSDPVLF